MSDHSVAQEEIRFAVVLNGGVSLAVWMGGVVAELDRLTRAKGVYGSLLNVLASTARADVISGTSAGGINGAALALAQVNDHADLLSLRELWAEQGRMESLLRTPFQGAPPSLLRGDDHFLPQLASAMHQLARPFSPRGDADALPIDLTIRTTLLRGVKSVTVDALGHRLPQTIHEGAFHFVREPSQAHPGPGRPRDDFSDDTIEATAARLALAARSTASFPVAFEPSFVPVTGTDTRSEPLEPGADVTRPDMSGVVSWRHQVPGGDASRFAVDGGLLANTPTRDALAGIGRMPGGRAVRRVVLLVYPHAPINTDDPPDAPDGMPSLAATAGGLLGALSSQGSRTFVDEVEAHNRRASGYRSERSDILTEVGGSADGLRDLAERLLAHYRTLRRRRVGRSLAPRVATRPGWSLERIRAAAASAQDQWTGSGRRPALPYVGDELPRETQPAERWQWGVMGADGVLAAASDLLKRLSDAVPVEAEPRLVERRQRLHQIRARVRAKFDAFDRQWDVPALDDVPPSRSYWLLRLAAFEHAMLGRTSRNEWQTYQAEALGPLPSEKLAEARQVIENIFGAPAGRLGRVVACLVAMGADAVRDVLDLLADDRSARLADLELWQGLLPPGTSRDAVLARLLCLEIVTSSLSDEPPRESDYPVDLVQLSLQTKNAFAHITKTADDKVGGMAIMRFSGFLKRSWRVNDWTWGRLDAATTLCQILLKPDRLRRVAELSGLLRDGRDPHERATELVDRLCMEFFGSTDPAVIDESLATVRTNAIADLEPVYDSSAPPDRLPTVVPHLAELAAWGLHLRIAAEELPALAAAVRIDQLEGANTRSRGAAFLEANKQLLEDLSTTVPAARHGGDGADVTAEALGPDDATRLPLGRQALTALDRAGIGREALQDEGTSDQMIRTVATAVGVAVTVADGDASGLGPARKLTRALRGGTLLPYWTVSGLTRGGSTSRFLALLALAVGGTLVALALFGLLPAWASGPGAAIGIGTLLGAFAYAALRTGSVLHGVVLLSPVIPLVVYAIDTARASGEREITAGQGSAVVLVVVALVLGLILLGSLPAPLGSPLAALYAALDRVADRRSPRTVGVMDPVGRRRVRAFLYVLAVSVVSLALSIAAVVALVWLIGRVPELVTWIQDRPALTALVAVLAVVFGAVGSYQAGWSMRLWRRAPTGATQRTRDRHPGWKNLPVTHPAASAAGWAVVYGTAYLIITAVLVYVVADIGAWPWAQAALITGLVFAGVLLLVVPWSVPRVVRHNLRRRLLVELEATARTSDPPPTGETELSRLLCDRLEAHGITYRYLCEPRNGELDLTRSGRGIAKAAERRVGAGERGEG